MMDRIAKTYSEAVLDADRDRALGAVRDAIANGVTPEDVVFRIVLPAMDQMAESLEHDATISLAQHYVAAQIADVVTTEMVAKFRVAPSTLGRVIIGTADGDLHSLGKRIVGGCLKARMIDVVDLGVNVSPERFVDEAVSREASIIAISAMMVHTARGERGCMRVRSLLQERGLSSEIRIVVGGAPYRFDHELYWAVGADAWAKDGVTAGKVIANMLGPTHP
jgi:methanogenic corrinoid protein MtbC1